MTETLSGEVITVWECIVWNDCEGRTGTHTAGWFLTEEEAKECFFKSQGCEAGPSYVKSHLALKYTSAGGKSSIHYLLTELKISSIEVKIRERALAKLTEDEKRALGLK